MEDALRDFYDVFDFQWKNLVEVPEASLTKGGLAWREAMMAAAKVAE